MKLPVRHGEERGSEMSCWYARGTVDPNDVSPSPSFFNLHFLLRNNGEQLVVQMEETSSTLAKVFLSGCVLSLFCFPLLLNSTADPVNRTGPCRQYLLGIQGCAERSSIPKNRQI